MTEPMKRVVKLGGRAQSSETLAPRIAVRNSGDFEAFDRIGENHEAPIGETAHREARELLTHFLDAERGRKEAGDF